MKVSEITTDDVAEYLRLDSGSYTEAQLERILASATSFVQSYTGLTPDEIDTHDDFYTVVLILCQDMYDNRSVYTDKSNLNQVVKTILGMHRVNLL